MGNKASSNRNKFSQQNQTSYTQIEIENLKKTCLHLLDIPKKEPDQKKWDQMLINAQFNMNQFTQLFSNDSFMGENIFNWMKSLTTQQSVTVDIFVDACEYLMMDPVQYSFKAFNEVKQLEALELFICLILKKQWDNYNSQDKLNRDEVNILLKHIFLMFNLEDQKTNEAILNDLFEFETQITFSNFAYKIKEKMAYLNRFIRQYFQLKFFQRGTFLQCPQLKEKSHIISQTTACLFYLNGIGLSACDGLYQIYTTYYSGTSFNRLAHALMGYNAPTMIVIKHVEKDSEGKNHSHIFGGYNANEWVEQLQYQGCSDNFIFKLKPTQRQFYVYNGEGGQNYCYFNTKFIENSKYKVGLGFGGNQAMDKFRIWIDDELEEKSMTLPDDKSYANGFLLDPSIQKLGIYAIEVWGIGTEKNLQHQHEYRMEKMKELQKMRKVDKKMMFAGQVGDMFIPALTKHKDQLREEVQRPQDFSDEDDSKMTQNAKNQKYAEDDNQLKKENLYDTMNI